MALVSMAVVSMAVVSLKGHHESYMSYRKKSKKICMTTMSCPTGNRENHTGPKTRTRVR